MINKLRFYLAVFVARSGMLLMRVFGYNATHAPGVIAQKICPDFLKYVKSPSMIIAITGTNGKTTVTNLLGDFFESQNLPFFSNSYGSNTVDGIAATYVRSMNFFGKLRYDRAVLEIDERSALKIFKHVHPHWLVVTNLFRDSYPRNAHPDYIFNILEEALPNTTNLLLNSDDLISCFLKEEDKNPRHYFSMDFLPEEKEVISRVKDVSNCPRCDHPLTKEFIRYNHIGRYNCENCGFKNYDASIRLIAMDEKEATLQIEDKRMNFPRVSENPVDSYNLLAAVSLLYCLGYDLEKVQEAFKKIHVVKSRYDKEQIGHFDLYRIMAKSMNPIASSRTFDYIRSLKGDIAVVFANPTILLGNRNSEQMAWLYDLDFEYLTGDNIKQLILCGKRYKDYEVCLRMHGIDPKKIYAVGEFDQVAGAVDLNLVDNVVVLNDTDTIDRAEKVKIEIAERMKEMIS